MSHSIRIDDTLYKVAKCRVKAESRTISKQIEYWARVGRTALDNPDTPVELIRDAIIARAEKSEPFAFIKSHARD